MIYRYTIYSPDGTSEEGQVDWPADPCFAAISRLVQPIVGGTIERVRILDPAKVDADEVSAGDYRDMFVDDMGHMRIPPSPRNNAATMLAARPSRG